MGIDIKQIFFSKGQIGRIKFLKYTFIVGLPLLLCNIILFFGWTSIKSSNSRFYLAYMLIWILVNMIGLTIQGRNVVKRLRDIYPEGGSIRNMLVLLMYNLPIAGICCFVLLITLKKANKIFRFRYLFLSFCLFILPITFVYYYHNSIEKDDVLGDTIYYHVSPTIKMLINTKKEARLVKNVEKELKKEWQNGHYKRQRLDQYIKDLGDRYSSTSIIIFIALESLQIVKIKDHYKKDSDIDIALDLIETNTIYMDLALDKKHFYNYFCPYGIYWLIGNIEVPLVLTINDLIIGQFLNIGHSKIKTLLEDIKVKYSKEKNQNNMTVVAKRIDYLSVKLDEIASKITRD